MNKIRHRSFNDYCFVMTGVLLVLSASCTTSKYQKQPELASNTAKKEITLEKWLRLVPEEAFDNSADGLSNEDKIKVLRDGKYDCWDVKFVSPIHAEFKCSFDQTVSFWLVRRKENPDILLQETTYGQNISLSFWTSDSPSALPRAVPGNLIKELTGADFLDPPVPEEAYNHPITCYFVETPSQIKCAPHTWMEPFWEEHPPVYSIYFDWNGESYAQRKVARNIDHK